MTAPTALYLDHRPRRSSFWPHFFRLALMTLVFLMASAVAILYAMGYQVNYPAYTIQQTGSIYVDSANLKDADSYLNGKKVGDQLPLRATHLFPGTYTLVIQKKDYQTWEKVLTVNENKVDGFHNAVFVLASPQPVDARADWLSVVSPGSSRISVRNGNELWLDGTFLTRTSQDISAAQLFPNHRDVAYVSGSTLWLLSTESLTTQTLLSFPGDTLSAYAFRSGGRILVYRLGSSPDVQAVALWE